jgi:hypothetical protein
MAATAQLGLFDVPKTTRPLADICRGKHHGNPNSEAANARIEPYKATMRERLEKYIAACGPQGATALEIAKVWGKEVYKFSGRLSELKRDGIIFESGRRRDGAEVLVAKKTWCQGSSERGM